jgi:hypothetical protein
MLSPEFIVPCAFHGLGRSSVRAKSGNVTGIDDWLGCGFSAGTVSGSGNVKASWSAEAAARVSSLLGGTGRDVRR